MKKYKPPFFCFLVDQPFCPPPPFNKILIWKYQFIRKKTISLFPVYDAVHLPAHTDMYHAT